VDLPRSLDRPISPARREELLRKLKAILNNSQSAYIDEIIDFVYEETVVYFEKHGIVEGSNGVNV
jgi:hypothetical protein